MISAGMCTKQRCFLKSIEYDVQARTTLQHSKLWIEWFYDTHFSATTNIAPPCDSKIAVGHIAILIKFRLIVQPYQLLGYLIELWLMLQTCKQLFFASLKQCTWRCAVSPLSTIFKSGAEEWGDLTELENVNIWQYFTLESPTSKEVWCKEWDFPRF